VIRNDCGDKNDPARSQDHGRAARMRALPSAVRHQSELGAAGLASRSASSRCACSRAERTSDDTREHTGSLASKVIIAAGPPENNASSIELQAPVTLARNTLGTAITTTLEIASTHLSATARLHVIRSLFADMADPSMTLRGGAACVDLVPGHIISGYVFDRVMHISIRWPSGSTRGQAGKCRHLVPTDEVPEPDRFVPFKAQQTINDL
jgi:hypothetical protein